MLTVPEIKNQENFFKNKVLKFVSTFLPCVSFSKVLS